VERRVTRDVIDALFDVDVAIAELMPFASREQRPGKDFSLPEALPAFSRQCDQTVQPGCDFRDLAGSRTPVAPPGASGGEPNGIVGAVQEPTPLIGHVVAVRPSGADEESVESQQIARGPLTVRVVIDGLPVGDLPAGARLRIGAAVLVAIPPSRAAGPRGSGDGGGLLEAGERDLVPGEVLEDGPVKRGDVVALEAVALPLADALDLHTFHPKDVERVVSEYLDEACRAGLGEVRIVHGRGQGVQRAIVRRLLRQMPAVARFADAPPTRGGWGATVVSLRRIRAEDVPPA
jgi:hypothetical protein